MNNTKTSKIAYPRKPRKPAALAKISVEQEFIDPKQAVQILQKHNPTNRTVDRAIVTKLAAQMEAGQWLPGVSVIRFDPKGNLVDGQHTLYAIEKTDKGQWLTVIRGVPAVSLNVINTSKSLSLTAHPEIKNLPYRNTVGAMIPFIYKYEAGLRGQQLFGGITNYSATMTGSFTDLLKTYHKNKDEITKFVALGAKVSTALPVTASTVAQAAWLFNRLDPDDTNDFFEKLRTGLDITKDSPIYMLRNRLITDLSNRNNAAKASKAVVMAYFIKAWNYYRSNVDPAVLTYKPGGATPEKYPEPI